jgi:hypothetical protein
LGQLNNCPKIIISIMKNYKLYLLVLFAICLCLCSCQTVMMKYYGASNPRIENTKTIAHYLEKKELDTSTIYKIKNFKSFVAFSNDVMIPNGFFYNKNGYYVDYNKTPKNCNANVGGFISDLKNLNQEEINTKNLKEIIHFITDKNGNPITFEEGYDVYILITWAKFVGKLNEEKAFEWVDLIKKASFDGLKIKYYLVNTDFQETWNDLPADSGLKKGKY